MIGPVSTYCCCSFVAYSYLSHPPLILHTACSSCCYMPRVRAAAGSLNQTFIFPHSNVFFLNHFVVLHLKYILVTIVNCLLTYFFVPWSPSDRGGFALCTLHQLAPLVSVVGVMFYPLGQGWTLKGLGCGEVLPGPLRDVVCPFFPMQYIILLVF